MWERFMGVDLLPDYSASCREKLQITGFLDCAFFQYLRKHKKKGQGIDS
jgi:hypothetical protein